MLDGAVVTKIEELNFPELKERYRRVAQVTESQTVGLSKCEFYYPEGVEESPARLKIEEVGDFVLSDRSYRQLAGRLGMSGSYFKQWDPQEQLQHFGRWLAESDKKVLVRHANGRIRCILPENYAVLDNYELMDLLEPMVADGKMQLILFSEIDARFFMRFRWPRALGNEKDPLFGGFNVQNSEVGSCKFLMDELIWREVCSNGLIHRYCGESLMQHDHLQLQPHELVLRVQDSVALAKSRSEKLVAVFESLRYKDLDEDQIVALYNEWKATRTFPKRLVERLEKDDCEFEPTWFGLINEITRQAQNFRMDRRLAIEATAGSFIRRFEEDEL